MGDGQPKYLNTAETSVFHKKRNLYGFNWAKEFIVAQDTAIVVEGYTDCIACWEAGIKNVVATLGTALTEHHVKTLTRFAKRIVYMFDGDAAGQKAARFDGPALRSAARRQRPHGVHHGAWRPGASDAH